MDKTSHAPIKIQIILPEDSDSSKTSQDAPLRYPGDVIDGYLEVTTDGSLNFDIDLCFQG